MFDDAGTDTNGSGDIDAAVDAPPDAPGCPTGQTKCGTECVDLKTNNDHCGACDTDCGAGTCQTNNNTTICCPAGQTNCNGTCVDLTASNDHCGMCGTDCNGPNNDTGGTCQTSGTSTICCPAGQTNCNGTCVDTTSDEVNCGGCAGAGGVTCGGANPECCNSQCTNLSEDEGNCGMCGTTCSGTDTCHPPSTGTMPVCCAPSQVNCNGTCVDTVVDNNNCGGCGNMCQGTTSCQAPDSGSTPACCESNQNNCDGTCSDPLTDNLNCGGCGIACGTGETCSMGLCCGPGKIRCGNVCVDPLTDDANCGACGNNCPVDTPATPVCSGGFCSATCGPGETSCGGDCVNTDSDHGNCGGCAGAGGVACAANEVCSNGTCTTTCTGTEVVCNGACVDTQTDPNFCGNCTTVCAPGDECVNGMCQLDCPAGEELCGGVCKNTLNDVDNCGACGNDCNGPLNDTGGTCQNGMCCAAGLTRCGNTCVDLTSDTNCGSCGNNCTLTGDVCTDGICCAANEEKCGTTCSDPLTDNNNCGMCGIQCTGGDTCSDGICCAPGEQAVTSSDGTSKICCTVGFLNCGGTCVNPDTDPNNCGGCGLAFKCGSGQICSGGVCGAPCDPPKDTTCGICTNTSTDVDFCGAGVCAICATGGQCVGGVCGCPSAAPDLCGNGTLCTNTQTDLSNCGTCGIMCGANESCSSGKCCPSGQINCNGTCVDINSDEANCGGCAGSGGAVCGTGSVCNGGTCECPFGQIKCGTNCVTPSVDPLNCGSCGNICGTGTNAGEPYCVSNDCSATCPAPLVGCGTGANAECANLDSDNDNCGMCGKVCPAGQGCSAGVCVPKLALGPDPAKCEGGGPPISVPTGGGEQTCSGNLGATSFTFGLCSRTNIGPLSAELFTDAFNSKEGPYKPSCVTDADCGTTGKCIGDPANGYARTCAGGGLGINGTVAPVASNAASTHVGGDFWVFGSIGLVIKNDTTVKQRMFNKAAFDYTKTNKIFGDAYINGPWSTGGNADLTINGTLYTAASPCSDTTQPLSTSVLHLFGTPKCTQQPFDTTLKEPCGTAADLIPVRDIVEYFRNPANNDNAAIGLAYDALANPTAPVRIELPCGYYYLDSLGGNQTVTLVVKGRTALFIGGAANINVEMIFDVEPTASLDMFVGGVVRIAHPITLGSPAYPRLTRMYIGNSSVAGGGAPCTSVSECGSGLCTACPNAPFGPCSATPGLCVGGNNLSKAIDMSQGGSFNGLLWAGYGAFSSSNNIEMYGSIFTNYADYTGGLKIHYDNAAVLAGDECPPPTGPTSCESCRDCNNQACVNNQCGMCTSDSQCCPPLRCDAGTCKL